MLVAALDMIASRHALASLQVQVPDIVRLSVGRKGEISLRIRLEKRNIRQLRLGLVFPSAIHTDSSEQRILISLDAEIVSVSWPVQALKQGRFILDRCYLETVSSLILSLGGFWNIRASKPINAEIRVYPDIWSERQHLSALFMNQGIGVHRQHLVGKGREFDQLREYQPGDSYEDIHWKATAKRRQPITRVHQVERTQQVYVIIDASRMSARPANIASTAKCVHTDKTSLTTILDRFITAAMVLGMAAQRQGDLFGLLVFNDNVQVFLNARSGKAHFGACRDALYTIAPKRVSPDFIELFTFIGTRIRRRSLMLFLTSLDDPVLAETFTHHIDIISRRHLVSVTMLNPLLAKPLFESPSIQSIRDLHRHLGGHFLWQTLRETAKTLNRRGVNLALPDNTDLCPSLVSRYLAVKQRQLL
ncbi:DUF58 domain-containing protein [Desulfococcaceae bacterium HSG9]|nr:DUF58 domain-containing protein [Desulfococcaceae bacterium HSG9]